jgi:hypothetical protein
LSRLFYCTAIDDEDPDGVVTITLSAPRARLLRMTLPTTRTPLARMPLTMLPTQLVMTPKSRTSPPHRLVGQWMMPAMVGVGNIAGILAAAASPPSHI